MAAGSTSQATTRRPRSRGDPAEAPRVRADVPDDVAAGRVEEPPDEIVLDDRRVVTVRGVLRVVGPLRSFGRPVELADRPLEAVDERPLLQRADGGSFRGRGRLVAPVGEPGLGPGVGVDVRPEAEVPACPAGEQPRGEVERDPVDEVAEHQPQPDVAVRHERERGEEVLAELAIGDPGRPLVGPLEREGVDEDGPAAPELDVVGGRVAEREALLERERLGVEGQEGGIPEHAERPLVRIRDEIDPLRPDDRMGRLRRRLRRRSVSGSWPTRRPRSWRVVSRPLATRSSQSAANEALICRRRTPSRVYTNPDGSRNEPGSRRARSLSAVAGTGCAAEKDSGRPVGRRRRGARVALAAADRAERSARSAGGRRTGSQRRSR